MSNYSRNNPYAAIRHVRGGMRRGIKGMLHDAANITLALGVLGIVGWIVL